MSECNLNAESSSSRLYPTELMRWLHWRRSDSGLFLLVAGRVSLGATAAFFAAIDGFQQHYWGLVWNASIIYNDLRYIRDFFEFIDSPRLDFDMGTRLPGPISRGIELDKVSFTYPGSDRPALADVSVTLRPGERIALVGENGAGKTTLAKILMGLYEPTSGRIVVDGVDLKEMALADWYRRIGAVFQDFTRYQVSLRENIGFEWLPKLDDAEAIASAAARSGAAEVAASLPRGLETPLGREFQEGSELSVGQWQRLAIARAYLRPAEILILDEPASGLDAKAEAGVYHHFARMAEASTVVLISHRLGSWPASRPHPRAERRPGGRAGHPLAVDSRRRGVRRAVQAPGRLVSVGNARLFLMGNICTCWRTRTSFLAHTDAHST